MASPNRQITNAHEWYVKRQKNVITAKARQKLLH